MMHSWAKWQNPAKFEIQKNPKIDEIWIWNLNFTHLPEMEMSIVALKNSWNHTK